MFRTFQITEPGGLPLFQQSGIYDYFTFDELLALKLNKLDKDIDKITERRVEGMKSNAIRVPQDCKTLKDAVALAAGSGKYAKFSNGKRFSKIVVGKGVHRIKSAYLDIPSAMNIVGDRRVPRSEIVVVGGIGIEKGIQGNCHLQHLTLRQSRRCGVCGYSSFTMEDVLVEECGQCGVYAVGTGVGGRCTNVEVRQCGWSGVYAATGASITLRAKTAVHHNCTKGDSDDNGLKVYGVSSRIQLVSPLTKEEVSVDNGGGGNWGAENGGVIKQIKTITEEAAAVMASAATAAAAAAAAAYLRGEVRVPEDCKTLEQAAKKVHAHSFLTTIVVGKGEHRIGGYYLDIPSAMNIVGVASQAKSEIVVAGGVKFEKGIQGNCHLQHLTLRQAKGTGVVGQSSFTMEDVLVEQCGANGVFAWGTGVVGMCTNVEVRQCGRSGVIAYNGASVTLLGAKTRVHHNCTKGGSKSYGLKVYGSSSSTIQLVSPLTKEQVSVDNGGGGNWGVTRSGDDNQLKNMTEAEFAEFTAERESK